MDGQLPALVGNGGYLDLVEREREEKREEGEGRIEREEEGVCSSKIVESTVLHWCTDKEFEMSCYLLKIRAR